MFENLKKKRELKRIREQIVEQDTMDADKRRYQHYQYLKQKGVPFDPDKEFKKTYKEEHAKDVWSADLHVWTYLKNNDRNDLLDLLEPILQKDAEECKSIDQDYYDSFVKPFNEARKNGTLGWDDSGMTWITDKNSFIGSVDDDGTPHEEPFVKHHGHYDGTEKVEGGSIADIGKKLDDH